MRHPAGTTAVALSLGLATTALAGDSDGLPRPGKNILTWTPAEQAVGYRRIEDVAQVAVIARGSRVHPLPKSGRAAPRIAFTVAGQAYDLDSYMKAVNASGVLVLKDGKIVIE